MNLRDLGYPWKTIVEGRKNIGRVFKHARGGYCGVIGTIEVGPVPTEREAFQEVGARHLGFPDAAALRSHNSAVSAQRRAGRAVAEHAVRQMLAGDFSAFDKLLGKVGDR